MKLFCHDGLCRRQRLHRRAAFLLPPWPVGYDSWHEGLDRSDRQWSGGSVDEQGQDDCRVRLKGRKMIKEYKTKWLEAITSRVVEL